MEGVQNDSHDRRVKGRNPYPAQVRWVGACRAMHDFSAAGCGGSMQHLHADVHSMA